ncbi:MAG: ArsR/SmtB family transcription factor [Dehalococcoidia bacterium]
MRTLQHPVIADLSLPAVLYALSDPVRLQIVQSLARSGERACGSFGIPLAKATLSHHFKVLRETGVIAMRAVGTQRLCSLRHADLDARFPGLLDAVLRAGNGHAGIAPHPIEDRTATTRSAP